MATNLAQKTPPENVKKRGLIKKGQATQISDRIAGRLAWLRFELKMSQRQIAEELGVTFQQYQKYENGIDRLSLERAIVLCKKLDLPLSFFDVVVSVKSVESAKGNKDVYELHDRVALTLNERKVLGALERVHKSREKEFIVAVHKLSKNFLKKDMTNTK